MTKFIYLCFAALILFDCNQSAATKKESDAQTTVAAEKTVMNENSVNQSVIGDLEFTVKTRLVKKGLHDGVNYENDFLYIDYTIKNNGGKDYLIFNQGHTNRADRAIAYVEPQANGAIEISQKAFAQPTDKNCPLRDAPVLPRAARLKAKQVVRGQVGVALPLTFNTPFADCAPPPAMPAVVKQARFCLGVAEADQKKIKLNSDDSLSDRSVLTAQKLLCSDAIRLD